MANLENEIKTTLKSLFAEKKKVKDLEKKLQEVEKEKNILKEEIGQLSSKDSEIDQEKLQEKFYLKLKETQKENFQKENEEEILTLKKQLQVVKPTLKRLVDELKKAREQIEQIGQEKETLLAVRSEINQKWEESKAQIQNLSAQISQQEQESQSFQKIIKEKQNLIEILEKELSAKDSDQNETPEIPTASSTQELEHQLLFLKSENEQKDLEIRKAQQHLAKKIKETTLLRDLLEKQKEQFCEMQHTIEQQKTEINRLQNHFQLQRFQEEKTQELIRTQIHSAEEQIQEWQGKCGDFQKKFQDTKAQMTDLFNIKSQYEELTEKFMLLKTHFAKGLEILQVNSSMKSQNVSDLSFDD